VDASPNAKGFGELKAKMILDESDIRTRYGLYRIHNRCHEGQIVLVWFNGSHYSFTLHDSPHVPAPDWTCIGELTWEIVGDHFVNQVHPLRTRSAEELAERAKKTAEHKAYRAELYRRYSLAERVIDLAGPPTPEG
jgi:hypothetical protein